MNKSYLILVIVTRLSFPCHAQENFLVAIQSPIATDTLQAVITSTMDPNAVKAGMSLLDQGGSAVDAALSVALSQITRTQGKWISFAGIFNMLYYEAETGRIHNLNASFNTVKDETDPKSIPYVDYSLQDSDTLLNGRTVLVPGFMKGVGAAHAKFGKLPFAKVTEYAIGLAENGFVWTSGDMHFLTANFKIVTKYPQTRAIFTNDAGQFYKPGDIFRQPELAETLRRIARRGTDFMYTGKWAKKFVKTVRKAGGKMTMQDMRNYEVIWSEPVHGSYHQYDIYSHGAPAIGGARLVEKLNVWEAARLTSIIDNFQSPEALYQLYLLATFPHSNYISFDSTILSKEHAARKWHDIKTENELTNEEKYKSEHSSGIVATDRWGNMAVILHSINTVNWGSNGLFIEGVSIPDPASFQQYKLMSTEPGTRLPDETCPGIVFKDGKPVLGFSCVGGGLLNQTTFSLINVLDFNQSPQQVNEGPNIGSRYFSEGKVNLLIEPRKFSPLLIKKAEALGASFQESDSVWGRFWSGVLRDYKTGEVKATTTLD